MRKIWLLGLLGLLALGCTGCGKSPQPVTTEETTEIRIEWVQTTEEITTLEQISVEKFTEEISIEPILTVEQDNELQMLAKLTYAEAGNQDDMGKRLVIDTVLNRVDDARFPDSITDVINQPNQYTYYDYADVDIDIYNLILDEIKCRTNNDVLYFRTGTYHDFAEPVIHHQDHYFSK